MTAISRGKWTLDAKTGLWREGSAKPRLEPEHMRDKPSEITTKHIEEGDKIHEEDPPHVAETIVEDWKAQDKPKHQMAPGRMDVLKKLSLEHADKRTRLSDLGEERRQLEIDIVRMRILFTMVDTLWKRANVGLDIEPDEVNHVWFAADSLGAYSMRRGVAPPNKARPRWTKNMELELDLNNLPRRGMDLLKEAGVERRWPKLDLGFN